MGKGIALAATLRSDHLMVTQKLFDQILKKVLQFAPVCDIIIIVNEKGKEKKIFRKLKKRLAIFLII